MALSAASATGGQQGSTQNPQTVPAKTLGNTAQAGGVQPGTSSSVLTSNSGQSLSPVAVTAVSLNGATSTGQVQAAPARRAPQHHVSAATLVIPIVLVLLAVVLFWGINRSAKSTTNY